MTGPLGPRLLVALDFAERDSADALVRRLDPARCRLKVGKELFTRAGPDCVARWQDRGFDVFLDLKYHDIPATVAAACRAAADLGVWMLNVHALGGRRMLEAARSALGDGDARPLLVAVTVLTSIDDADLAEMGLELPAAELTGRLAGLAAAAGLDGIVCSARDAATMRARFDGDFALVTPGIRPGDSPADDQRRTATPAQALAAGATYLVVGRPITAAGDPAAALRAIAAEVEAQGLD